MMLCPYSDAQYYRFKLVHVLCYHIHVHVHVQMQLHITDEFIQLWLHNTSVVTTNTVKR